jgi:hypothetical protein
MTHTNNVFELSTIEPVVRIDGTFLRKGVASLSYLICLIKI